jgi:adenine deaminase
MRAIAYARGETAAPLVIKNVHWLDVFSGCFQQGDVAIADGKIVGIGESYQGHEELDGIGQYLVPGFIDSHVHVESSLMTPLRFQQAALPQGTTAVIWDPHEIANVYGAAGIRWALAASEHLTLDFFVMVPSCVPSTSPELEFETSGASLTSADLEEFRGHPRVLGLAEMMNFPGVLNADPDVSEKLLNFQGMPRDGHCPGLQGRDLNAYAVAGIHSCHESTTFAEAATKLSRGIHVLIREGSCAKDADALLPLINERSAACLGFCSDDRNPLDILDEGHISCIINKALRRGISPIDAFRAASYAPAVLYGLKDRGAIAPGYTADVCLIEPLKGAAEWTAGFALKQVFKGGIRIEQGLVEQSRQTSLSPETDRPRNVNMVAPTTEQLAIAAPAKVKKVAARVIEVIPEQILTRSGTYELNVANGAIQVDLDRDILKIGVWERHHGSGGSSLGLVKGFGLKTGAIATSINHDSHNVIAVGSHDDLLCKAIDELITIDGGIVVVGSGGQIESLALPIGGLMTDRPPQDVAEQLRKLKSLAKQIGCSLAEPFLQLSFLALPVIPSLKITDRGLVDVDQFTKVPIVVS